MEWRSDWFRWLFEVPVWICAGWAIFGFVMLLFGWKGGRRMLSRIGSLSLLASLALWGLGSYVETSYERVTSQAMGFVADIAAQQWPSLTNRLSPDVKIGTWGGRDMLMDGAKAYAEQFQLESATVTRIETQRRGDGMETRMNVVSRHKMVPMLRSEWRVLWSRQDSAWKATRVIPVSIEDLTTQQIEERYFSK